MLGVHISYQEKNFMRPGAPSLSPGAQFDDDQERQMEMESERGH